jgi:uncharacterized Zn-binding protein involved in type VI secretion
MPPAVRVADQTAHGFPLNPGPGSSNVIIGFKPAWRAVPAALAGALQAVQQTGDIAVKTAESATKAASGTPGQPAALAAEAAAKAAATAAFAAAISSAQGAAAGMTAMSGNGTPDMHNCTMPAPVAPGCFHGPGVVLQASTTVTINGLPATRVGDKVVEALGGPDAIVAGENSVLIG